MMVLQNVDQIIEKIAKNEGFTNFETDFGEQNKKGEGFLGEIVFVTIKEKNSDKKLDLIIKRAFRNDEKRDAVPVRAVYENEISFYTKIWPELQKIQGEDKFENVPKIYIWSLEELNEYLVLDNLKKQDFILYPKSQVFIFEIASLIFKTYGRFHALSLAFKRRNPEEFAKLTEPLLDFWGCFINEGKMNHILKGLMQQINSSLNPDDDKKLLEKLEIYEENGSKILGEALNYKGKNSILTHGDCWSNNFMFKEDEDKNIIDMKMLDWQLTKSGSVVHDLSYCLYSGASKEVLDRLDDLLKIYHDSLSNYLKNLGEDPEEIFPFSTLKEEWKQYSRFGLILGFMLWRVKLVKTDELDDDNVMTCGVDQSFEKRAKELALHALEIGIL